MPNLRTRVRNTVKNYLRAVNASEGNWSRTLARIYNWGSAEKQTITNGLIHHTAKKFGLHYLGHGATRVAFRFKNTNYIVKIEKETPKDLDGCYFNNSNLKELNNYKKLIKRDRRWKYLLAPIVYSFKVDGSTVLVLPLLKNGRGRYSKELIDFYDYVLEPVLPDSCPGHNDYYINRIPISIDYGFIYISRYNRKRFDEYMTGDGKLARCFRDHRKKWDKFVKFHRERFAR